MVPDVVSAVAAILSAIVASVAAYLAWQAAKAARVSADADRRMAAVAQHESAQRLIDQTMERINARVEAVIERSSLGNGYELVLTNRDQDDSGGAT